jgi:hypothetical protein
VARLTRGDDGEYSRVSLPVLQHGDEWGETSLGLTREMSSGMATDFPETSGGEFRLVVEDYKEGERLGDGPLF